MIEFIWLLQMLLFYYCFAFIFLLLLKLLSLDCEIGCVLNFYWVVKMNYGVFIEMPGALQVL